jgi:hypothetical protein
MTARRMTDTSLRRCRGVALQEPPGDRSGNIQFSSFANANIKYEIAQHLPAIVLRRARNAGSLPLDAVWHLKGLACFTFALWLYSLCVL